MNPNAIHVNTRGCAKVHMCTNTNTHTHTHTHTHVCVGVWVYVCVWRQSSLPCISIMLDSPDVI